MRTSQPYKNSDEMLAVAGCGVAGGARVPVLARRPKCAPACVRYGSVYDSSSPARGGLLGCTATMACPFHCSSVRRTSSKRSLRLSACLNPSRLVRAHDRAHGPRVRQQRTQDSSARHGRRNQNLPDRSNRPVARRVARPFTRSVDHGIVITRVKYERAAGGAQGFGYGGPLLVNCSSSCGGPVLRGCCAGRRVTRMCTPWRFASVRSARIRRSVPMAEVDGRAACSLNSPI